MDQKTASAQKSRGNRRVASREGPDPIDVHVGKRIHLRRLLMGMSQSDLGDALGLSFQQVQKYERGSNRVSASALYRLANRLDVPVSFFFEGFSNDPPLPSPPAHGDAAIHRDSLDLLKNYQSLPPTLRRQVSALLSSMSGGRNDEE